jgi:hypothetical protein
VTSGLADTDRVRSEGNPLVDANPAARRSSRWCTEGAADVVLSGGAIAALDAVPGATLADGDGVEALLDEGR